jgi:Laminin G domain
MNTSGVTIAWCVVIMLLQVLVSGQLLDDDRWHTLNFRRRAQLVELTVDNSTKSKGQLIFKSLRAEFD